MFEVLMNVFFFDLERLEFLWWVISYLHNIRIESIPFGIYVLCVLQSMMKANNSNFLIYKIFILHACVHIILLTSAANEIYHNCTDLW